MALHGVYRSGKPLLCHKERVSSVIRQSRRLLCRHEQCSCHNPENQAQNAYKGPFVLLARSNWRNIQQHWIIDRFTSCPAGGSHCTSRLVSSGAQMEQNLSKK